jgi:molybdate transport system substrate-binding protein
MFGAGDGEEFMRGTSFCAAFVAALAMLQAADGIAAEVRVLSIPFKEPMDQIGPEFERATGHKLVIKYAPSASLLNQVAAGEPFDLILIFPNLVDSLIGQGKVAAGTRVDIARAGLGLAVRKGAPKPDVGSVDALKGTLLKAQSIAYAAQGPSGVHLIGVLERLGIATEIKPKLRPMEAGSLVVGPVARGEAEIGIVSVPFILAEPGAELAGLLPSELQSYVSYSSGIGSAARDAGAAKALVHFFSQPGAMTVLRSRGLEPIRQ